MKEYYCSCCSKHVESAICICTECEDDETEQTNKLLKAFTELKEQADKMREALEFIKNCDYKIMNIETEKTPHFSITNKALESYKQWEKEGLEK